MFDIREIFDPSPQIVGSNVSTPPPKWTPREIYRLTRSFYKRPLAWLVLGFSALVLIYGGGALMFWYHSIYLGEGGPAIDPTLHWFVDSTAGLALTPALAVILPIASRQAHQYTGGLRATYYALVGGTLFALATTPGPVLHDNFVGRGTWLAGRVTQMWGNGRAMPPGHHFEPAVSMSLQLAFALPVYIILMWLTLISLRAMTRAARIYSSGRPRNDTVES